MVSQRWLRIWIIQKIHFGEGVLLAIFNNLNFVSLRWNNQHEFDQDRKEFENGKAFNGFSWLEALWRPLKEGMLIALSVQVLQIPVGARPHVKHLKPNQQGARKIKNTSSTAFA